VRLSKTPLVLAIGAVSLGLVLSGCSSKSTDAPASESDAEMLTGVGVTDDTITLGALTDQSGVYAALGNTLVQGNQLYFDQRNADGGVCERDVEIVVRDHGSDVQTAVSQFAEIEPDVLGFVQLLGSPQVNAVKQQIETDDIPTFVASWSSDFLGTDPIAIAGTIYPLDVINGLQYFLDEDLIAEGDKIGHVYFPGDFGENALKGSTYFAEEAGLDLVGIQVEPTATDLTAQITQLADEGVSAVVVSAGPRQTASIAAVSTSLGLDVPILSNGPGFDPALLDTPAKDALVDRLYLTVSYAPFASDGDQAQAIQAAYEAAYPEGKPTIFVNYGYAVASVFGQALDAACEGADLTREGVIAALRGLPEIETGIFPPLTFSNAAETSSTQSYILRVSPETPGGLVIEQDLFESELAAAYTE
jgi:ABC-type branched-subunit amino acid transport system substrate-binding protein